MNPQHFNNIARWSPNDPLNAVHFASLTTGELKTAEIDGQDSKKYKVEYQALQGGGYLVNISPADTQAQACTDCLITEVVRASDETQALLQIGQLIAQKTAPQQASPAPAQPEQEAAAEETIIEKYAKVCERTKSLQCYKNQLVKLSKDEDAKQEDVMDFFKEYLRADLREALTTPVHQFNLTGLGGFFTEDNRDISEEAHQVITDLMEDLHKDSGKSTRAELMRLQASYFSEQARYAQSLIQQSFTAQDPYSMAALFNMGNGLINELQWEFLAGEAGMDLNTSVRPLVAQMFTSLNQDRRNAVIPALGGRGTEVTTPGGSVAGNMYELRLVPRFAGDLGTQILAPSATPQFSGNIQVVPSSGPTSGVAPGYNQPQPPLTTWPQQTQPGFQNPSYQTPGFNPNGFNPQGNQQFGVNPMNTRVIR